MDKYILAFEHSSSLFYTIVAIYSLLVGSFLNVVIHRLPKMLEKGWTQECQIYLAPHEKENEVRNTFDKQEKLTLATPRSTCPNCQHKITVLENMPILSWLILRGKCSQCDGAISIRYPLIEGLTAVLSVLVASKYGVSLETIFALIMTWCLICLAFIDYDHMLLPDQITLPLLWLGLLVNVNGYFVELESAVIGATVGYLLLFGVGYIYELLTGGSGMGNGDYKLTAVFGAWFGWSILPYLIGISALAMTIVGSYLIVCKGRGRNEPLPFGPFLAISGWFVLIYGVKFKELILVQLN